MIAMEPYQEKPLEEFSPIRDFLFVKECDENARDSILAMLDSEQNIYFQPLDYSQHVQKSGITYDIRNRIAEWIFEVADYLNINRECAVLSISLLDRFLQKESVNLRTFKLVSIACVFIGIKHLDPDCSVSLEKILSLMPNQEVFHKNELEAIELWVLNNIDWKLHPPTPFNFVRKFLRMLVNAEAPSQRELFHRLLQHTRYLCELAVCDYDTVSQYPPSRIAVAAIVLAIGKCPYGAVPIKEASEWRGQIEELMDIDITTEINYDLSILLCEASLALKVDVINKAGGPGFARLIWSNKADEEQYSRIPLTTKRAQRVMDKISCHFASQAPKYAEPPKAERCQLVTNQLMTTEPITKSRAWPELRVISPTPARLTKKRKSMA